MSNTVRLVRVALANARRALSTNISEKDRQRLLSNVNAACDAAEASNVAQLMLARGLGRSAARQLGLGAPAQAFNNEWVNARQTHSLAEVEAELSTRSSPFASLKGAF